MGQYLTSAISLVSEDSTQKTLRLQVWYNTTGGVSDSSNTFTVTGDWANYGGAVSISVPSGGGSQLIYDSNITVSKSYGATQTKNFAASLTGINYWGASQVISTGGSDTVAARPYALPAAPTSLAASRASDTQQNLSWTNTSPGSSSAPYAGVLVQRRDNVATSWVNVATLGVVTSYADPTTAADRDYEYCVIPYNSSGNGTASASAFISTTPAAPSAVAAAKSGSDIVVTFTINSLSADNHVVEKQANGGSWVAGATLAAGVATWTDVGPSSSSVWKYRVKATASTPALASASVESNSVQLLAAPNAPTPTGPTTARDASEAMTLTWVHNPVDTTPQTKKQIQYRTVGSGTWIQSSITTSPDQNWSLAAAFWANGVTKEWQVRTWGSHTDPSPWSATSTIVLSTRPTATISSPATTVTTSKVTASWAYYDAESTAQTSYLVELRNAGGTLLESKSGSGAATSKALDTVLPNGFSGSVKVYVTDSSGMTSLVATKTFSVAYALPPKPDATADWDPDHASVILHLSNPGVVGGEVAAVSNNIYRKIDDGVEELIYAGVPTNITVTDWAPTVNGVNTYRVEAVSATPSVRSSDDIVVTTPEAGDSAASLWLSRGPALSQVCRAIHRVSITEAGDLAERAIYRFAGRTQALEFSGDSEVAAWNVSFTYLRDASGAQASSPTDWVQLGRGKGPFLLRTPEGLREYVSVSGMVAARAIGGSSTQVSFLATKVGQA